MEEIKITVPGFELVETRKIRDFDGVLIRLVHVGTQADIIWLKRPEENKTFAITFKTIPSDDTGVFHILEHSVLNGSRKYPVREPFVNLLKGSMKTFLNAMTFSDKTMYPVSSRNEKDFHNLVSVYLDAVFYPLAKENEKIFAQEGWHYELKDAKETPVYKGVVLNEMKGAFASVDETIVDEVCRMLFPDTCYRYVSGGDPEHITELSYEQFKAAHDRFYHPSNAGIFLDGDLNIEETLYQIKEYLDAFSYRRPDTDIPFQEKKEPVDRMVSYEIGEEEGLTEKTHFTMAKILGDYTDVKKSIAWGILSSVLNDNNESPLKKAILEAGLGQDVDLDLLDGIQQPFLLYCVKNTETDRIERIRDLTRETVEKLVNGELSHSQILAAINHAEFMYREKKEPSGVILAQSLWMSLLYGGDPALYLDCGECFDELRRNTEEGYFENLLKEAFLQEPMSTVTVVPSAVLGKERAAKEQAKLKEKRASWTEENVARLISFNRELEQWQSTEDTPEQAATIPTLTISDIEQDPRPYEPEEQSLGGVRVLRYPDQENGIVYWNLYFALNGMRKEDLPFVSLFAGLLSELATGSHTVRQLQEIIEGNLGVLTFNTEAFTKKDPSVAMPVLTVTVSMLKQNASRAAELIREILQETVFDKETVRPIVQQMNEELRRRLIESGHAFAAARAGMRFSAVSVIKEQTSGFRFLEYLNSLAEDEAGLAQFAEDAEFLRETLFTRERLTISVSGTDTDEDLKRIVEGLPSADFHPGLVRYALTEAGNDGIVIPGQVSYAARAADLNAVGREFSGTYRVLSQIATYEVLWNEVRVKGGAYGTGFSVSPGGILLGYSYRDPDPENALKAIAHIGQLIMDKEISQEELNSYIIGTISSAEPLQTPLSRQVSADARWFSGMTYEDRRQLRHEILNTTVSQLKEAAKAVSEAMNLSACAIVGTASKLDEISLEMNRIHLPSAKN